LGVGALALVFGAAPAWAAFECIVQVSQPTYVDEVGPLISDVTLINWWSRIDMPGVEVSLTVAPSAVPTREGAVNRNAANLGGITLEFPAGDPNPMSARRACPGLFGDTLKVIVDLSALDEPTNDVEASMAHELVATTVECLKINARRRWPVVRHLDVRLRGAARFAEFARAYDLSDVEVRPGPRQLVGSELHAPE
jgi:hypothetical protein